MGIQSSQRLASARYRCWKLANAAHDSSSVLTAASIVALEAIERFAMLLDAAGLRSRLPPRACSRHAKIRS
jgi:hypothetical protein